MPGGQTWASWLYHQVLCGLSHCFTIETGGIEVGLKPNVAITVNGPEIEPAWFIDDFGRAWLKYLQDVKASGLGQALGRNFDTRFQQVFYD